MANYFTNNTLKRWIQLVLVPLLAGAAVYCFFRAEHPAIFGSRTAVELPIPGVLLQSLPSLLWSFALSSALLLIWQPSAKMGVLIIAIGATVVSVFFEFWQAASDGHGTFDWNDCLFSVTGCLFSLLVFQKIMVNENHI